MGEANNKEVSKFRVDSNNDKEALSFEINKKALNSLMDLIKKKEPLNSKADLSNGKADSSNGKADSSNGKADSSNDKADLSNDKADLSNDKADLSNDKEPWNFKMDSIESKIKEQLDILFKEYRTPDPNITDKFYIKNIYDSIETKKVYNIERQIEIFGYFVFLISLITGLFYNSKPF
jgi:hypothetical protein